MSDSWSVNNMSESGISTSWGLKTHGNSPVSSTVMSIYVHSMHSNNQMVSRSNGGQGATHQHHFFAQSHSLLELKGL